MKDLVEVRWHGRGGQGAVTAAKILAESALNEGKNIQAFPEYGAERSGAPVRSFTRISSKPILIHDQVKNPDIVAVLDSTLMETVDVCAGLVKDGALIINTPLSPEEVKKKFNIKGVKVHTVDATSIAIEKLGRNIPNTPMVGALVKVSGLVKLDTLLNTFKQEYSSKFKAEVIEGNVAAIKAAHGEVRGE